jgi:hypothetical protein
MPSQASPDGLDRPQTPSIAQKQTMSPLPKAHDGSKLGTADGGRLTKFAAEMRPGQAPGYSGPDVVTGLEAENRRNKPATPICLRLAASIFRIS